MLQAVRGRVLAGALGVLGFAALSTPAVARTQAQALPSYRVSVQAPPKHFTAYFAVAARRRGHGPIGQLRSVVALVGIPRRSRVEVRCTRDCTRRLRKAARWRTSGTGMAIGLSVRPRTIVTIRVTAPNGGVRTQRYRFSRTNSALLIREIKSKPKRKVTQTPADTGSTNTGSTNTGSTNTSTTGTATAGGAPGGPQPVPDRTAPSVPTGLATSAISQTSITLGWTRSSDNVGVTGYTLWLNGGQVGTVTGTTFAFSSGLACGRTYQLAVQAVDAAKNVSGKATVSAGTAACPPPPNAPITVDNRVTNGATQMREDTPAYLSTVTRNFCKRDGCALSGTDVGSGAVLTAECTVFGDRTTNGQDGSTIDDGNPGLYSSTRWYGIRWGDTRFGYISEVWITAGNRGGMGLRNC